MTTLARRKPPNFPFRPSHFLKPKPNKQTNTTTTTTTATYMRDTISNIYKILKYSTWDSAKSQLQTLNIKWDSYTVNQVLKTHPPMQKSWLFFNWAAQTLKGFKHDHYTYTTMLDIFGEAGRIESMNYVFQQMREKGLRVDGVVYTAMMHWVSKAGDFDEAVRLWREMKEEGFEVSVVSYTAYLKILFENGRVEEAGELYKEMIEAGCVPNCYTYTVLMEYLVGSGKCKEALEMFYNMQETGVKPDKAACNILVEKCSTVKDTGTMMQILQYMKDNRLVLRYPVFMQALNALEAAGESSALLRQVNPHITPESCIREEVVDFGATDANICLDEELVLFLLKKQNIATLNYLLVGIMEKNIQLDPKILTTIIEMNCGHCRTDGALLVFEYSTKMGIKFERSAYLSLIGSMIRSNTFAKVVEIVKEMGAAGHSLGTYMGALLIYKLGIARRPTIAAKVFSLLSKEEQNIATYTAMISVYFSAGSADKALKIYKTMQRKGIHAVLGTYNVLLAGLEKKGKTREADTYRKEKKNTVSNCHSNFRMEEKIADLLFAGDMVS